ncbi:MAG TPA: choice-of-anchor tandem repeat GloVer-containing protein [Candidatus Sulfotelmatobacter sp.]
MPAKTRIRIKTGTPTLAALLLAIALFVIAVPTSHASVSGKEHVFTGAPDGSEPDGALLADGAGNFYGTTSSGGFASCALSTPFCGTVYKMTLGANGSWTETVLYKFEGGSDGAGPAGPLIFDSAGNIYGTTTTGGNREVCNGEGCGTVFKLSPNLNGTWTETLLRVFLGGTDVAQPASGVVMDAAGNLYGTGIGGCIEECSGTIFKLSPNTNGPWNENILYTFLGGTDGGFPSSLVFDRAGNLYGTSSSGGNLCNCGTVFELSPSKNETWQKTVLYSFNDGLDGGTPSSSVIFDGAGNLYGETFDGGSFACPQSGCGVVYRLTPESGAWKFKVIYTFNGLDGSKGAQPSGGLTIDSSGNLYGTTSDGGNLNCNNGNGCGSIFKLSSGENRFTFSKVFQFNGASGSFPITGVIVDSSGNLYGSTFSGGNPNCNCGVVFEIHP